MRSLFFLILLWLGVQLTGLLFGVHSRREGSPAADSVTSASQVDAVLRHWPSDSQEIARSVIAECGRPDVVREGLMRWNRRGDLAIVLYRDAPSRASAAVAR